jgi:hypothetical protein
VAHDVYFVFFFDMCMEAREEQEWRMGGAWSFGEDV